MQCKNVDHLTQTLFNELRMKKLRKERRSINKDHLISIQDAIYNLREKRKDKPLIVWNALKEFKNGIVILIRFLCLDHDDSRIHSTASLNPWTSFHLIKNLQLIRRTFDEFRITQMIISYQCQKALKCFILRRISRFRKFILFILMIREALERQKGT